MIKKKEQKPKRSYSINYPDEENFGYTLWNILKLWGNIWKQCMCIHVNILQKGLSSIHFSLVAKRSGIIHTLRNASLKVLNPQGLKTRFSDPSIFLVLVLENSILLAQRSQSYRRGAPCTHVRASSNPLSRKPCSWQRTLFPTSACQAPCIIAAEF